MNVVNAISVCIDICKYNNCNESLLLVYVISCQSICAYGKEVYRKYPIFDVAYPQSSMDRTNFYRGCDKNCDPFYHLGKTQ